MVSESVLRAGLAHPLSETHFSDCGTRIVGKVRDSYVRAGRRYLVATDRISAFDRVLGTIPYKGQVLTQLSAFWFERTRHVAKSHLVSTPDPQVMECIECTPILVEMVVRAYATGTTSTSLWTHYERGARVFSGHSLPEGLNKHQKLPAPLVTPTTKAPKGEHDVSGSREEIVAMGKVSARDFDEAAEVSLRLFAEGSRVLLERGLLLVDTKYEFGRTATGELVVMDEIHTPDSSRFWRVESYEQAMREGGDPLALDKDVVRRELSKLGYQGEGDPPPLPDDLRLLAAKRYIEAYEAITGREFSPNEEPPIARIRRNLGLPDTPGAR